MGPNLLVEVDNMSAWRCSLFAPWLEKRGRVVDNSETASQSD